MKNNQQKPQISFDGFELHVTLPRRNFARMSQRQLLRTGKQMYTDLQEMWRAELRLPDPCWAILESITEQLKMLEEGCPEVCQP
jgi:hypothetical protein